MMDPVLMVDPILVVDPISMVNPIPMVDPIPLCHPHYVLNYCLRHRSIEPFRLVYLPSGFKNLEARRPSLPRVRHHGIVFSPRAVLTYLLAIETSVMRNGFMSPIATWFSSDPSSQCTYPSQTMLSSTQVLLSAHLKSPLASQSGTRSAQ